ncbi:DUF4345 domain-containing protein [Saccharothrix australiensis]|uniref:Uncharacterized protein DUF4345 n=1 Tax=Saccharothrix australiensis TaxID=2072 RepID=A0A495W5D5_9PSEU|nr:DUF4345 domain-containing protein [Saccharothrix australiensis]RKT55873.1 uncharacterized protein DUF4345 [Saccharothrix australiensis]
MTALRVVLVLLGLFVVGTGLADVVVGPAVLPGSPSATPTLDSHYRFFATMWLALGVVLLWVAPRVDRATAALRGACAAVFAGGVARIVSLLAVGPPHGLLVFFIGVELVLPPALVWWQRAVSARAGAAGS